MIPVKLQQEPVGFDVNVRQKGQGWLVDKGIKFNASLPSRTKLPSYWSWSNELLWTAYSGTCAYLAIFFEWPSGASSTDHYVPKTKHSGLAYEWDNSLIGTSRVAASKTIKRLKLDSPHHNAMRARHFAEYIQHGHSAMLKKQSPFVWYEADRQGLL